MDGDILSPRLREILVCPECKGELEYRSEKPEELICQSCRLAYPVREGIPVMLAEEARKLDD